MAEKGPRAADGPGAARGRATWPVVVIGVGNALRGDDAAGLEVARRVRSLVDADRVIVLEHEGETLGLIERWAQAAAAVLVDATHGGSRPGSVARMDASATPLQAKLRGSSSTHAVGLAEAIELARALGRLPERVIVYGIEGASFVAGGGLSREVRAVIPAVAQAVAREALQPSGAHTRRSSSARGRAASGARSRCL